jgi:hypothetical protein
MRYADPGTHGNGVLLAQVVLTRAVSFADDFAGARAYAGVSATAETVLDVHRNGCALRHRHDHLRDRRVHGHLRHDGRWL